MKSVLSVGFADDDGVVKELGEGTVYLYQRDRVYHVTERAFTFNKRKWGTATIPAII